MEFESYGDVDGVPVRTPVGDEYRTCGVCGADCVPDAALTDAGLGARVVFSCPTHGPQSVIDPFGDSR